VHTEALAANEEYLGYLARTHTVVGRSISLLPLGTTELKLAAVGAIDTIAEIVDVLGL
jgi:hypothetical protein